MIKWVYPINELRWKGDIRSMIDKPKKKKFEVQDGETISGCLDRMKAEGYEPIRRMEEPVFIEVKVGNKVNQEFHKQKIIFEGKLK